MRTLRLPGRARRGSSTTIALVVVVLCVAVAAGSTLTHMGGQRDASTVLARERAFQAADAGIDWAMARLREAHAEILVATETRSIDGSASFKLTYTDGTADQFDDDGDGTVDESDESGYAMITSVGMSGSAKRTVRAILALTSELPILTSSVYIDSTLPILTVDGQAFEISGEDHTITGTVEPSEPTLYGISTSAMDTLVEAQVPSTQWDQIDGTGGEPSVSQSTTLDIDDLIATYERATTILLAAGTHTTSTFGTATETGVEVVRCDGDLHFSGNTTGAGVLIVKGDLLISGRFEWVGMVLVQGRATFTGSGGTQRVCGSLICGDELSIGGNAEILYSSDGMELAGKAVALPMLQTWLDSVDP